MTSINAFPHLTDTPFETIFRWKINWTSIFVKPILTIPHFIHFRIKLLDGSLLYLWKNDEGDWQEAEGCTDRSTAFGDAIDMYYRLTGS